MNEKKIKMIKKDEEPMKVSNGATSIDNKEDLTIIDGIKLEVGKSYYVQYKHCPSDWKLCRINRLTVNGHPWSDDRGGVITDSHNVKTVEDFLKYDKISIQKISRKGLKEIYEIASIHTKNKILEYGNRNQFDDYVELTQEEVDNIYKSFSDENLKIVSKYLKLDNFSVYIVDKKDIRIRKVGKYEMKGFTLNPIYNWEIKKDDNGDICLIPSKIN